MTVMPLLGVPVALAARWYPDGPDWLRSTEIPIMFVVWAVATMALVLLTGRSQSLREDLSRVDLVALSLQGFDAPDRDRDHRLDPTPAPISQQITQSLK